METRFMTELALQKSEKKIHFSINDPPPKLLSRQKKLDPTSKDA